MTAKITVSLPDHLVEQARRAVEEGKAASVSAYVAEALQEKLDREPVGDFFEMFDKKWGPPTEEDTKWAREQLDRIDREMAEKRAKGIL